MFSRIGSSKRHARRRLRRFRRRLRRVPASFGKTGRRLLRRVPLYTEARREARFVRLVGPSQAIRFVAGRLRGAPDVRLTIPGVAAPLFCRTAGSDRWALWHVFGRRHLELTSQRPPRLIVDGGANVGYASVYFANRYPDARIVAVEPDPENVAMFRKNCATYPNIELVQGALWSSSTDLVIENPTARSHAFRVAEVHAPTDRSIKGFTVSDIIARSGDQRIDLLKMDIEGSEGQLFSSNFGDWAQRVGRMLVETHSPRLREAVAAAGREHGFSLSKADEYLVLDAAGSQGVPGRNGSASRSGRSGHDQASHSEDAGATPEATALRLAEERQLLRRSIEHLHGPEEVPYEEDELVVVCLVRDGRPYVRSFVEHYTSLGVKHMVFLDNNSIDGTVEALRNHANVTVLRTKLPYKAVGLPVGNGWTREVLFKQYLISRFGGKGRWCLCADMDELFEYPYSDVVGLGSFLGYLTGKSYTAVMAHMLDMFSERPLSDEEGSPDAALKDSHRFYDISDVASHGTGRGPDRRGNTYDSDDIGTLTGGIRQNVTGRAHHLSKVPLVFDDGRTRPMDDSSHRVGNARVADVTGALLHYKFVGNHFRAQVDQALREEHRLANSATYKRYAEALEKDPSLQLKRDTAQELKGVNDLVENGFLVVSDDYLERVSVEERQKAFRTAPPAEACELTEALLRARQEGRAKTLKIRRLKRQLGVRQGAEVESQDRGKERLVEGLRKQNRALKRRLQARKRRPGG